MESDSQLRYSSEEIARLFGQNFEHHQKELEYWRNASDEEHGEVLYQLLLLTEAIGVLSEKGTTFPGIPHKQEQNSA